MKHIVHICYILAVAFIVMAVLGQIPSLIAVVLTVVSLAVGNWLAGIARRRFNAQLAARLAAELAAQENTTK